MAYKNKHPKNIGKAKSFSQIKSEIRAKIRKRKKKNLLHLLIRYVRCRDAGNHRRAKKWLNNFDKAHRRAANEFLLVLS